MNSWWTSQAPAVQALISGAVLIVVVFVAGIVVMFARRRALLSDQEYDSASRAGFSAEELEALRQAGKLTEEEFRLLRRRSAMLDARRAKADNSLNARPKPDDGKDGSQGKDQSPQA